jgi:hypothetical protein
MLLSELLQHPNTSRNYLERYINDGSPSGFSTVNTTKPQTSPFELNPFFYPNICIADKHFFKDYGLIPDLVFKNLVADKNWIIVHPDMKNDTFFHNTNFKLTELSDFKVIPTASGRTVQIYHNYNEDYIKLHYSGILGRVRRELPFIKAVSGPEISNLITKAIDNKILNDRTSLFPELGARVLINEDKEEWGMVWRQNKPYNLKKDMCHFIFPSFSLFSIDRINSYHYPLLKQIIDAFKYNPKEYVLEVIVFPLLKSYFEIVSKLGLQPELNSQNLMLSFNKDFSICSFIIRDLESVDKDLTIMKEIGQEFHSLSYPFKFIDASQFNYYIKHSFMFDFKLGESILEPILVLLEKYFSISKQSMYNEIKLFTRDKLKDLPTNFFPNNKWYVFDKVLVDQTKTERPYIEYDNPKFR